jgi:hypothetical protein
MEPREYWLEPWHRFGNRFGYGGGHNPECAVEPNPVNSYDNDDDDTSRGTISADVPLVATQ